MKLSEYCWHLVCYWCWHRFRAREPVVVPWDTRPDRSTVVFVAGLFGWGAGDCLQLFYPHMSILRGTAVYSPSVGPLTAIRHRVPRLLAHVRAELAASPTGRIHLVGHSFGCPTIMALVSAYPELVPRIASVSCVSPLAGGFGGVRSRFYDQDAGRIVSVAVQCLVVLLYAVHWTGLCMRVVDLDLSHGPLSEYLRGEHLLLVDMPERRCRQYTLAGLAVLEAGNVPVRTWVTDDSVPVHYGGTQYWFGHPHATLSTHLASFVASPSRTDRARGWEGTLSPGPHDGVILVESQEFGARDPVRVRVGHIEAVGLSVEGTVVDIPQGILEFVLEAEKDITERSRGASVQ